MMVSPLPKIQADPDIALLESHRIDLYVGKDVFEILDRTDFQADWDQLYKTCVWATAFQSRAYVTTWYKLYHATHTPVIVTSTETGKLNGLLTMSIDKSGCITGAGACQAEYQVWLAHESNGEEFIKDAISKIKGCFKKSLILFRYIPSNTPMSWASQDPLWNRKCLVRALDQPLLIINDDRVTKELKKKNRKEKINRLNRLGKLEFIKVIDEKMFTSLVDQLSIQYDFRQGAKFNKNFFKADPLRKPFLVQLFRKNLLHVTIFKLNDEIIASHAGVSGKNWVHLQGFNTYSPIYSKFSPGILHFLLLGKQLASEGIEAFDFTPGKDAYKKELASDFKQVYELSVCKIPDIFLKTLKLKLFDSLKILFSKLHIDQENVKALKKWASSLKDKFSQCKKQEFLFLFNSMFKNSAFMNQKISLMIMDKLLPNSPVVRVNRNHLEDFLDYEAKGTWVTRWEFLQDAMHRFEVGERSFTWREEGRLLGCAWLCEGSACRAGSSQTQGLSEESILLQGFYFHPAGRQKLQAFLAGLAAAAQNEYKEKRPLYVLASQKDIPLCQGLEAVGFRQIVPR